MRRFSLLALVLAACTPAAARVGTTTTPAPEVAPPLPAPPLVTGPIALRVQYPSPNALVAARDSTFLFGTTGTGEASLTVNGRPVRVLPNGAWLAWQPVPRDGRWELVAARGADTVRRTLAVRLAPVRAPLADTGRLAVDSASVAPGREYRLLPAEERARVSVRAPASAAAWVQLADGRRLLMASAATMRGARDPLLWGRDVAAGEIATGARVVVARGADTVALPLAAGDTSAAARARLGAWAVLGADSSAVSDTDRVVIGRPVPGGTYKWFFLPGTVVQVTGVVGDQARVRLDDNLDAWVDDALVRAPVGGVPAPRRVVGNLRVVPDTGWVDLVIPVGDRPPYAVQATDDGLALTLYGTVANVDIVNFQGRDSLVRRLAWEQVTRDRARLDVALSRAPYGWLVLWRNGSLVLRVRRPPAVDARRPLNGIVVAVDPGHPPIGATGPTGYYEGEATLAIGQRLRAELERRGATVVMTRTTMDPVPLGDRPILARRAGAHVFVSIHLNALPDGINPYAAQGTGTYWFNAPSASLARQVQAGMVARMGLPDLGVYYDNLAVVRPTWMPAVLCEGAFVMIPEQEAALRTPEFQERYARGVADGLEAFFRGLR